MIERFKMNLSIISWNYFMYLLKFLLQRTKQGRVSEWSRTYIEENTSCMRETLEIFRHSRQKIEIVWKIAELFTRAGLSMGQPADVLPPSESWRNLRRCLKTVRSSAVSSALWLISCVLSGGGSGTRRRHSQHISGTTLTQWQHGSVLFALSDAAPTAQCL